MDPVNASPSATNPFSAAQVLFLQSQQLWQERATQTADDMLELYKAGLEYTTQITSLTLGAARRSFDLLSSKA
jgi:hypothetical protein